MTASEGRSPPAQLLCAAQLLYHCFLIWGERDGISAQKRDKGFPYRFTSDERRASEKVNPSVRWFVRRWGNCTENRLKTARRVQTPNFYGSLKHAEEGERGGHPLGGLSYSCTALYTIQPLQSPSALYLIGIRQAVVAQSMHHGVTLSPWPHSRLSSSPARAVQAASTIACITANDKLWKIARHSSRVHAFKNATRPHITHSG